MKLVRCGVWLLTVCTGSVAPCTAQTTELNAAEIRFEVLNPGTLTWGASLWDAVPGQRIEFRAVVSYTGTRTDLYALGEALYQPTISNTDNTGAGAQADQIGPWRNGGNGGNSVPDSMLSLQEGEFPGPLVDYGRVRFGGATCSATGSNTMMSFRHTMPGDPGPNGGDFIRMSGSFVTQWPGPLPGTCTADDINRITRGIASKDPPSDNIFGVHNLVVFRQAITLSESQSPRTMLVSTFPESFRRYGGTTSTDDRRYFVWRTGPADSGTHRTISPEIVPATIWVNIPSPGPAALALAWAVAPRRRRPPPNA